MSAVDLRRAVAPYELLGFVFTPFDDNEDHLGSLLSGAAAAEVRGSLHRSAGHELQELLPVGP